MTKPIMISPIYIARAKNDHFKILLICIFNSSLILDQIKWLIKWHIALEITIYCELNRIISQFQLKTFPRTILFHPYHMGNMIWTLGTHFYFNYWPFFFFKFHFNKFQNKSWVAKMLLAICLVDILLWLILKWLRWFHRSFEGWKITSHRVVEILLKKCWRVTKNRKSWINN